MRQTWSGRTGNLIDRQPSSMGYCLQSVDQIQGEEPSNLKQESKMEVDILHMPKKRGAQYKVVKHNLARWFIKKHEPNRQLPEIILAEFLTFEEARRHAREMGWTIEEVA